MTCPINCRGPASKGATSREYCCFWSILCLLSYRKIPKISPSMYKPLQIQAPTPRGGGGGLYLETALKYKVKQRKTVNFLSRIRLAQSILNANFPLYISPSKNKPLKRGLWEIWASGLIFGILRLYTILLKGTILVYLDVPLSYLVLFYCL